MITKARYLMPSAWLRPMTLLGMLALFQACTTTTIDEFRQGATGISSEARVRRMKPVRSLLNALASGWRAATTPSM